MGMMDFFRRHRKKPVPNAQGIEYPFLRADDTWISTATEEPYTIEGKCMNVPIFAEAVEYISDMMASMPVKLYHRVGDKIVEETDDKRIILLNVDTKSGMNGYQFKKRMTKDYLLHGGGYAAIRREGGKINGLFYVTHQNVSISNLEGERLFYRPYKIRIGAAEFAPWEFLKVLRDSTNGVSGTGILKEFKTLINALFQALVYTQADAAEGGVSRGIIGIEGNIAPDRREATLKEMYNGVKKICRKDKLHWAVAPIGISLNKMDDGYVKQDLTNRINMFEKSMRNLLHLKDDFYETFREAIFPVIKAFEAALNMDLLTTKEQAEYFFEVDTSEVLKADIKERYDVHKTALEAGIKTINEVRRDENLEEIEGLDWTKVDLGTAVYKDNKIHVVNTGEAINLTSQAEEKPARGGEKNVKSEMR